MNILNDLNYEIIYKAVKNVNMRIRKDGMLIISAPKNISENEIKNLILHHYDKFYKAQQEAIEKNEVLKETKLGKPYIFLRGRKFSFQAIVDTKYSYSIKSNKVILYYKNFEKDYEKMLREIAYITFNELGKQVSKEMGLSNIEIEEKKFKSCFGKNYGKKQLHLIIY